MAQDNWNKNQQILNYFWSRIGFEQGTNRLVIHDGKMNNLIYMNGWQVLNQNGSTYLYDSRTQKLFDRQLNYYYQGNYYDRKGNLLRDFVSESVIDVTARESIKKDAIFGDSGVGNRNIYSAKSNIKRQYNRTTDPYIINNEERFNTKYKQNQSVNTQPKQVQVTPTTPEKQVVDSQPKKISVDNTKNVTLKTEQYQGNFVNRQQIYVDKIVAEELAKQREKNSVEQPKKKQLTQKQLNGPTIEERLNTGKTQMGERIDTKKYGEMFMTQKVDEYSKIKAANASKQRTSRPYSSSSEFGKKATQMFNNGVDSATVGKILTGVMDGKGHELAAKIAADFSSYRYGKILSKLF